MEYVPLAKTARVTTRLGFGCAFPADLRPHEIGRLLDVAYDAGIRHFDVARAYNNGRAEIYLGNFLKRRGNDVTVTTKYGIFPLSRRYRAMQAARDRIRPIVRALRRIPAVDRQVAQTVTAGYAATKAKFSAEEAARSLGQSLRALRRDRVDLLLMHEPTVEDLMDDSLAGFLDAQIAAGRIGGFGIGAKAAAMSKLHVDCPAFRSVLQFDWSVFDSPADYPGSFLIHFGTFSRRASALQAHLSAEPRLCRLWSDEVGADLSEPQTLGALLLKAALTRFPDSIVLFATRRPAHILDNVRVAEDDRLRLNSLSLCALLNRDLP